MTELEKEIKQLQIRVDLLETFLEAATKLPVLGLQGEYRNAVRQSLAKAGLPA